MTSGPDLTDPFALLERWRATTPDRSVATVEPHLKAPDDVVSAEQPQSAEELLATIADLAKDVVPHGTLATFLAPVRDALATPRTERDPVILALDLDRLEDLLEAFLLAGQDAKTSEGQP
jgi:hypothetical protein